MNRILTAAIVASLALPLTAHGLTDVSPAQIRALYSNAAYEDVLSAIGADPAPPPEIGQYKVFSLIALGRAAEAEKAAEAIIIANPRFQPDPDASPRVRELLAGVRRRVAPVLIKSMYVNAKAAFDRKEREAAVTAFTEVVAVAGDADFKDDPAVGELRLLASGFLELSRALPADPAVVPADRPGAGTASEPENRVDVPVPAAARVVAPVPVREVLPVWAPSEPFARREYRGSISVHIDAEGQVVSSQILTPVHPLYDGQLLKASKTWTYKPGTSNGKAVPAERVVVVVLHPKGQ